MSAHQKRISAYAAKFAAETVSAEPAEWVEPTSHHLARILAGCVRPPRYDELSAIRDEFLHQYSNGGYGPQLPNRRMTYHRASHHTTQ